MSSTNSSSHHKHDEKRGSPTAKGEMASSVAGSREDSEAQNKGARSRNNGGAAMSSGQDHQERESSNKLQGLSELYPVVENVFKDFGTNISQIRSAAMGVWKNYPLYTVVGAAALGFAAGMAVSSSNRLTQSQDS